MSIQKYYLIYKCLYNIFMLQHVYINVHTNYFIDIYLSIQFFFLIYNALSTKTVIAAVLLFKLFYYVMLPASFDDESNGAFWIFKLLPSLLELF